jgi:hypothetical protein
MQHPLDGNSWSESRFGEVVAEPRFGSAVLDRYGWEGRVACRNDAFLDFAGLAGGGVGDVVTVVVVGDEGVDDVVAVVPGVGGYCYWQATAVVKRPDVAGHIAGGVRLRPQHGRSEWIGWAEKWRSGLCDEER